MLLDRHSTRTKSWAVFRFVAWVILLIRVSVQIADCVFYSDLKRQGRCTLILVFNGGCNRERFYGSPAPDCDAFPTNIGLWVDALTFAVITLQIIIFDSQYSDMMQEYLTERSRNAGYFSKVFEDKMQERQQYAKEKKERELAELKQRAQQLGSAENTIDHLLHAGVKIPPGVRLRSQQYKSRAEELETISLDVPEVLDIDDEEPKSKPRESDSDTNALVQEASKLSRLWKFVRNAVVEFVDKSIEFLEKSSSLYVEIVEELKQQEIHREQQEGEEGSLSPATHGSVQVQVEVHSVEEQNTATNADLPSIEPVGVSEQLHSASALEPPLTVAEIPHKKSKTVRFAADDDPLHSTINTVDDKHLIEFEEEFSTIAEKYSKRPVRLLKALQNALLAHADYVVFFLVIMNVILNGSVLSLGYAILLFGWGLLCIPWPSKTFWLTMIFYSMFVLVLKYGFQFYDINYEDENLQSRTGFSVATILGIPYYHNSVDFFKNAAWDMLLLISLLLNRGLLKQNGLWKEYYTVEAGFLNRLKSGLKLFFSRLLNPDISQGAHDYYVSMLFFDVLCLITIVLGVSSFGVGSAGGGVSEAAAFIQNNRVPLPFVIMLLLQFLSMLVDRAIYLRHALKTKLVFQIFLLVVWHLWLLFILPSESVTRTPFTQNIAAQCIYFFKCLYFVVSAMQITSGYPTRVLGYFLGQHYTTVSGLLFSGYRAIPLLPELREVMDWVFTDTALSLFHWLRVQEIYAKLYLVKVRRHREKGSPRELGEQQSLIIKVLLGGLLLVGLVLLLWGPLLVISFINSTSVPNQPVAATISLSLEGYEPLVQITVQRESLIPINNSEFQQLTDSVQSQIQPLFGNQIFQSDFTKAVFPNESTSLWTISPPAKELLSSSLKNVRQINSSITLQFSWSIQREPLSTLAAEVVSGVTTRILMYGTDQSTIDDLISNLAGNQTDVLLMNLYPRLIFAPETGRSTNYTELSRFFKDGTDVLCNTSLSSSNNFSQEWWTLAECTDPIFRGRGNLGPPILLIYSRRVPSQIFSLIAGFGIIGLYVSVVLVIGRLIRSAISSLPSELLLDEIVNPDKLLKLCSDIFTVRESKDFKLEEILVGKLFAIFRSPERLIELTEYTKKKQN